jgi:hypothetical protein
MRDIEIFADLADEKISNLGMSWDCRAPVADRIKLPGMAGPFTEQDASVLIEVAE